MPFKGAWFCNEQVVRMTPDWAYACFLLNCLLPGTGTMVSAMMDHNKRCRCDVVLVGIG